MFFGLMKDTEWFVGELFLTYFAFSLDPLVLIPVANPINPLSGKHSCLYRCGKNYDRKNLLRGPLRSML
jgi:hypothetical protein